MSSPLSRFPLASAVVKPRLIWAGWGEVGTGKTFFALGAPGPIVVQSFDKGLEGVVEPIVAATGKEIRVVEYAWSPQQENLDAKDPELQRTAQEVMGKFTADFEVAVQHARTVVWDRESDVFEVMRYAEFGAPNDAPKNYAKLYQRYRRLISIAKASDVNFGGTQGVKTVWDSRVNSKTGARQPFKTDRRERTGCDELEALVHIDLHHRREDGHFYIDVGKSRGPGGQDVQDQSFMDFSFTDLAMMIFPDTSEADWQ